jgi:transposase
MLLMTTLALKDDPLFFEIFDDNVNGDVFLAFIQEAVRQGRVPAGSIIVWDNARVPNAIVADLDRSVISAGATRANLPPYSPEFNPCELVFAEIKTFLRNQSRPGWGLRDRVLEAAGAVSYENLLAYHQHCTSVALEDTQE